jgi:hypothetical protein
MAFDNRFAVAVLRMPKTMDNGQLSGSTNGVVNTGFIEESQNNWSSNNLSEYSITGRVYQIIFYSILNC